MDQTQLTIVIPNRNRDLDRIKRSLKSVYSQLDYSTSLYLVDYGSAADYQEQLQKILKQFPNVDLILCPTYSQLWNKSRAINIVLKNCKTNYFMVCDMDMLWHPDFLKTERELWCRSDATYYTVGILTRKETEQEKDFGDYQIKFQTGSEATGITVFNTEALKSINGFDEYFHGWGAEDTDVHNRLRNAGFNVRFRDTENYFLHQWHPKDYRSVKSKVPFHKHLERINHEYSRLSRNLKRIKANNQCDWGLPCNENNYLKLEQPNLLISIKTYREDVVALCAQLTQVKPGQTIRFTIVPVPYAEILKFNLKMALGKKKVKKRIGMEEVNEMLLEQLVTVNRNCPYNYNYDRNAGIIELTIFLKSYH